MDRYGMGYLEDKFLDHSLKDKEAYDESVNYWKNHYSSDKLPFEFKEHFNFPLAILSMLEEIIRLRDEVDELKRDMHG